MPSNENSISTPLVTTRLLVTNFARGEDRGCVCVWYHASLSYMSDDDNKNKRKTNKNGKTHKLSVCIL